MTAATYQYVDLPDASVVTTRALLTARENITDTVAARAMMCIHGGAGHGKTLAVNTCLHELEPAEDVRRVTFRARPTARAVRYELFTALDLPGEPPRHPSEFDRLLKNALAEHPRTFLVDEAQWLNGEAFEVAGLEVLHVRAVRRSRRAHRVPFPAAAPGGAQAAAPGARPDAGRGGRRTTGAARDGRRLRGR